jgi:hypothetical protein
VTAGGDVERQSYAQLEDTSNVALLAPAHLAQEKISDELVAAVLTLGDSPVSVSFAAALALALALAAVGAEASQE